MSGLDSLPLSDADARGRIRDDLDSTLFVEAGAGTGKTHELVERVVRLVCAGRAQMRSIAAITFTEAAAAELRDRIREALERAARDESLPAEERERCRIAAGEVDAAAVETLHAFAGRILSSYPLEARLPPVIAMQDETRASIAFGEKWEEFIDRLLDDPAMELTLLRAYVLGLRPEKLRAVALAFHRNWDRLEDAAPDSSEWEPPDLAPLLAALSEACGYARCCVNAEDRLYCHLETLKRYCDRLEGATDELDVLRVLAEKTRIGFGYGNKSNWSGVTPGDLRDMLTEAELLRGEMLTAARRAALAPLLAALRRFVLDYADERRRQGTLEFHDLLVQARDLLRRNREVRRSLRRRFSHLLIDEFQDTDPLQIEIAVLLASDDDAGDGPFSWQAAKVEEGRLFFVGDPKQSIYRFRRADIALYQAVQRRFEASTVRLTQNFRSLRFVIDWVNGVFPELMGAEARDGQAAYEKLFARREPPDGATTVHLLGGPSEGNIDAIRAKEAEEMVAAIRRIKAEGWPVAEKGGDGALSLRPARYADIAVLMPTRTGLPPLEQALEEAAIPYRVESRSLVYSSQEVRDLLTILRAIDDPTDEVALVAALRSPAFGCSDVDLLGFRQANGRWDCRRDPPSTLAPDHPVIAAMASLRGFHEKRTWMGISGVVEAVIRERRLFEIAFAHRRPRERWQRLRFVLDQARAFVEAGGSTLRQFVDWAEQQAEEGTRVVETVVPEADDDAVRIMTIHASKGLEFPIAALVGLNVEDRPRPQNAIVLWDRDGTPHVRIGPQNARFETEGFERLAAAEEEMDAFEKVRLLYVAATRARDHLIVSLHHKKGVECHAARLHERCREMPRLWRTLEFAKASGPPAEERASRRFEDSPEERAQWLEKRRRLLVERSRALVVSATGLAAEAAPSADPNLEKDAPAEEVPPWRKGRAGTSLGRAVHAVLQSVDLATGEGLEGAAQAQAAAEGIPDRADEIARRVRAALDAPSVREAVRGRYRREVYVAVPVDGIVLEGFIDLLYETDGGLVVVDYKTDAVPDEEEMARAMARYRLQGAAYALAVERALGRKVVACRFVFVQPTAAREQPIDDLASAMEDARAAVRTFAGSRGGG
ncbi:MAG: UvrD-helicase domain-containing protein [Dehalococcoidia bacterium]|nr:UvrD-helicase domain-containing protein [Dehalococcoidia bacterium]